MDKTTAEHSCETALVGRNETTSKEQNDDIKSEYDGGECSGNQQLRDHVGFTRASPPKTHSPAKRERSLELTLQPVRVWVRLNIDAADFVPDLRQSADKTGRIASDLRQSNEDLHVVQNTPPKV